MWMQIKGLNTEIQDPFPIGTCFYFSAVAANQNFHLLSFCSIQVNLSSGAQSTVISAKKAHRWSTSARMLQTSSQGVHAAERDEPARSRHHVHDTQKLMFLISLKYQNKLLKFKMGFCFYTTCTLTEITMSTIISCLSLPPPVPSSLQQDILHLNLGLQKIL